MAGTLTVQNLQGPSSGANANKVIIPSGQTLDASGGTLDVSGGTLDVSGGTLDVSGGTLVPSADQVVQYKWYANTTTFSSAASAYTTVHSVNFTPKKAGNIIMARFGGHLYKNNATYLPSTYGRLAIEGSQVWQNNYITYHEADRYMYTLSVTGSRLATGTSQIAVEFSINPNASSTYLYANTGGMEVWEIAQ